MSINVTKMELLLTSLPKVMDDQTFVKIIMKAGLMFILSG